MYQGLLKKDFQLVFKDNFNYFYNSILAGGEAGHRGNREQLVQWRKQRSEGRGTNDVPVDGPAVGGDKGNRGRATEPNRKHPRHEQLDPHDAERSFFRFSNNYNFSYSRKADQVHAGGRVRAGLAVQTHHRRDHQQEPAGPAQRVSAVHHRLEGQHFQEVKQVY